MVHIELNSRDALLKLLKNQKETLPDNPQPRECKICGVKSYPIYVKGRFIWTRCDCYKAHPYRK